MGSWDELQVRLLRMGKGFSSRQGVPWQAGVGGHHSGNQVLGLQVSFPNDLICLSMGPFVNKRP